MHDLVLRGGTLDGVATDLAVDGEVITKVGHDLGGGRTEIDARGLLVLPGVVDAHVHLNDPGRAEWEGIPTGTAALAAGGATTCVDMPLNSSPPTLDAHAFAAKRSAVEGRAHVDVALWGGLVPGPLDRLDELAACGVVGFKAFMCASGIDDFPNADDETLGQGMRRAAALDLPVAVHAEDEALAAELTAAARVRGGRTWAEWLATRPPEVEIRAIGRAVALAEETGCALHVVHVSTAAGVALVAEARARGADVTCETCPHYLLLDQDTLERLGSLAKCAPPLREPADRVGLAGSVRSGLVDTIGSDHSPAPAEAKQRDDFFEVWGGIAGCQTLLRAVLEPELGLAATDVAHLVATAPAERLRLTGKGRLVAGNDADVVLVRSEPATLTRNELRSRHPHSPWVGRTFAHRVVRTILRGRTTWDGTTVAPPTGRLVRPERVR